MKRIVALCLAFLIGLGWIPTTVFAKDDAYQAYIEAVRKTTVSGSWSENLSMTADMEVTYDTAKAKTKVTLESQADISGYDASDPSGLYVTGSAEMKLMGTVYTWDMVYQDGEASFHYTSPGHSTMGTVDESIIFEFGSITEDMISRPRVTSEKITFTIPGNKMDAMSMSAISLTGADECQYGDVEVEIRLNKGTGTVDSVTMRFHASVTFNGAHAEADYEIIYGFISKGAGGESEKLPDKEPVSGQVTKSEWIAQHMEYASGKRYEEEIVSGYNSRMLRVFRAAADDNQIESYQTRKTISQILKLDFELKENEMYELLLAELMYGNTELCTIEETYEQNLQVSTQQTMAAVAEILIESKDLPENTVKSIRQLVKTLQVLQYGSAEYDSAYSELVDMVKNNAGDLKKEILGEACSTVLGIAADTIFEMYDSMEDVLTYINHYLAYQSTSQQIISVMEQLAEQTFVQYGEPYGHYQRGTYELADELGVWDAIINWPEFQEALSTIVAELKSFEHQNANAIAQYAAERVDDMKQSILENTTKKASIFAAEQLLSCIPVLNTIVTAKKAAGVIVDASIILEEIFTDIEDRAYAVDLLVKAYCVSVMLDETVQSCADAMSKDDLSSAMVFDASVMMYKKNQLLAVQYAIKYVDMVLTNSTADLENLEAHKDSLYQNPDRALNENIKRKLHDILIWYSQMRALLDEQNKEINQIYCHSAGLILQQDPVPAAEFEADAPLYIVTGPADILVTRDDGTQIACLSAAGNRIEAGYESYFQSVKSGETAGAYTWIATVPDGYSITMNGTGDGTLDAYVVDCSGFLDKAEVYLGIAVTEGSMGHFKRSLGRTDMVMDQVAYSGLRLSGGVTVELVCGTIAGAGIIVVAFAVFAKKRKLRKSKRR